MLFRTKVVTKLEGIAHALSKCKIFVIYDDSFGNLLVSLPGSLAGLGLATVFSFQSNLCEAN